MSSAGPQPPAGYTDDDIDRRHSACDPPDYRRPFARDYDRLVHTPAFRRLQGKTQVVTPGESDFFRTRLTHSIEVSQVAQRLAQLVGADEDLCQAAAILHDLGHPPFAHVGEEALNEALDRAATDWGLNPVSEVGGFNGNAQSFRLAVRALSHRSSYEGLDLTRGVLDGAIKYPYRRNQAGVPDSDKHWCFFPTEATDATWVRQGVPARRASEQSIEAQIVDWADDVAYSIHDVEDWYRAGFMPLEMLAHSALARRELALRIAPRLADGNFNERAVTQEVQKLFAGTFKPITGPYDGSSSAKEGLRVLRKQLFDDFIMTARVDSTSSPATRHNNNLRIDPVIRLRNRILKRLLWVYVIGHQRMATHQLGQQRITRELFDIHIASLDADPITGAIGAHARIDIFPPDIRDTLRDPAVARAEKLRLIADHIAGMTDSYAVRLHARLTGAPSGVFNAFL